MAVPTLIEAKMLQGWGIDPRNYCEVSQEDFRRAFQRLLDQHGYVKAQHARRRQEVDKQNLKARKDTIKSRGLRIGMEVILRHSRKSDRTHKIVRITSALYIVLEGLRNEILPQQIVPIEKASS